MGLCDIYTKNPHKSKATFNSIIYWNIVPGMLLFFVGLCCVILIACICNIMPMHVTTPSDAHSLIYTKLQSICCFMTAINLRIQILSVEKQALHHSIFLFRMHRMLHLGIAVGMTSPLISLILINKHAVFCIPPVYFFTVPPQHIISNHRKIKERQIEAHT